MTAPVKRPLGLTLDGELITDPYPGTSRLVFGATGAAKTTTVVVPTVQALIGRGDVANIVNDVKDGEVAAQIGPMARKYGRAYGHLDDFGVLGSGHPGRVSLNPFGAIIDTAAHDPASVLFAIDSATHALIPEVPGDTKNKYFRDTPREELDCGIRLLLEVKPDAVTPGRLCALMGTPDLWLSARKWGEAEGSPALQIRARQSLDMQDGDPEHYFQHLRAALLALRIYEPGSALHDAGRTGDLTHARIIEEGWIFCLVQPQRYSERVGPHYALHLLSFLHAQLQAGAGKTLFILDELCNAPLKEAVDRVTIQRSFGASSLYIAQSRHDIERKYGQRETAILEENCPVKQWLSFTKFEEAERVSRAMGETASVSRNLGVAALAAGYSSNLNAGKERVFTADELMNLDPAEQIIHIKGLGFLHCRKLYQNQIAPTCFDLAPNPLEGGILLPDPQVTLPVSGQGARA